LPDLLTHFAVAFAITAPFIGIRKALLAGLIALLPDSDVFIHIHRSITHSLLVLLAISLPIAYLARRGGASRVSSASMVGALISHPILDTFQTYTPILYPLIGSVYVGAEAGLRIGGGFEPYLKLDVHTRQFDFTPFTGIDGPLFAHETLPISLALIVVPLIYSLARRRIPAIEAVGSNAAETRGISQREIDPGPTSISPEHVTVVIPTLNEREAIGMVLDELRQEGYANVLVVDGYSSDGTAELAMAKGARVVYQHGHGKAGALKTALEHVKTPYMLVMDGDHTYDPRDIKRMLMHAANYDEIIGARTNLENVGWLHRLGNKIINYTFNLLIGAGLSDVCSGMYLIRTEALKGAELQSRGFNVEVEIAAGLCTHGRVSEVPINYRPRVGRRKLQPLRDGLAIVTTIVSLARAYNPVFLFSVLASALAIPGAILTLWQLYLRYVYGAQAWSLGVAWLGLVLIIVGLQGFTAATISIMLKRMERRIIQSLKGGEGKS
jgi:dolichol-phosphate mannosyltransferase